MHSMNTLLLLYPAPRIFTFFFLSPLFFQKSIPFVVKLSSAIAITLALTFLAVTPSFSLYWLIKELVIGYFLGFFLLIFFEIAKLVGELVALFLGVSFTEIVTPYNSSSSFFGKAILLLVIALSLSLDWHHLLLKFFASTYQIDFTSPSIEQIISLLSQLFSFAIQIAFFPLFIYSGYLIILSIASVMLPEIPLFFLSPALQFFLGVLALLASLNNFPWLFQKAFFKLIEYFL